MEEIVGMTAQFKLEPLVTSLFSAPRFIFLVEMSFYSPGPSLSPPVLCLIMFCFFYIAPCAPIFKVSAVIPGLCPSAQSQMPSLIRWGHKYFNMCKKPSYYCILQRKCISTKIIHGNSN